MTSREKGWLTALAVLAILALIELFYIPGHNPWLEALNNAGHLPVFGLLAIGLLHLVKLARPELRSQPVWTYGITLGLAAALGAVSELIQYFSPRDASWGDLGRDLLGAASFLALYAAVRDRDLKAQRVARPALKSRLLLVTGLLWLAGGWSLCMWSAAYIQRWVRYPVLCDFDSYLSTRFVAINGVTLEHGAETEAAGSTSRGTRMKYETTDWPGIEIVDVYPNWTGHDSLILDLTLDGDQPLIVALSAYDRDHDQTREDRFSMGRNMDPGRQRMAIALGRIAKGSGRRPMNMEHMEAVRIFGDSTVVGQSVMLERLYLK